MGTHLVTIVATISPDLQECYTIAATLDPKIAVPALRPATIMNAMPVTPVARAVMFTMRRRQLRGTTLTAAIFSRSTVSQSPVTQRLDSVPYCQSANWAERTNQNRRRRLQTECAVTVWQTARSVPRTRQNPLRSYPTECVARLPTARLVSTACQPLRRSLPTPCALPLQSVTRAQNIR